MARHVDVSLKVVTETGTSDLSVWRRSATGPDVQVRPRAVLETAPWTGPTVASVLTPRPFWMAWRCGGTDFPEFSEAGINGSIAHGYEMMEISVNRCASGEFVCIHNPTTDDLTGSSYRVHDTPWTTLSTLSNGGAPLLRLTDAIEIIGSRAAVAIDCKVTSSGGGFYSDSLNEEAALRAYLLSFGGATDRFLWKSFGAALDSRTRAKADGFQTMVMWYPEDLTGDDWIQHGGEEDVIGMDYTGSQSDWDTVAAKGKPTIAHILQSTSAVTLAASRGANGYMSGITTQAYPGA